MPTHSAFFPVAFLAAGLLAGCAGAPASVETAARDRLDRVGATLPLAIKPGAARPALPALRPDSPPADFVLYAVLNHPAVAAAYYDWRAAVESIASARALPDPKLTLQADIADTLMAFMPGLMFDFMNPGKRTAMSREATAMSEVARRTFVAAVLRSAAEVRKAWVELAYAAELDRLYVSTIHSVDEALNLANADYATARGMAGFEKQIRLQNTLAQHHAHHTAIADRLVAARIRFKSALGLAPTDTDPPWPQPALTATTLPTNDELWRRTAAANPELAKMRAMIDSAVAGVAAARVASAPDFSVGAMVDLLATPLMFRPAATVSLPVWREKIAATIAAAEARRDAAMARLSAEQLNMAAEIAQMLFMVREADRMLVYIDSVALPNLERGLAFAEAGAQSGMAGPAMISETRIMAVDMRHERVDLLRQRELAVVDLALLTADVAPAGPQSPAELAAATP